MNPQDLQKDIEEVKKKNEELSKKLEDSLKELEDIKRTLAEHTHSGNDGSTYIYQDSVQQKTQQFYSIGNFALSEATISCASGDIQRGYLLVGTDNTSQDGIDNVQLTIENLPGTDGDTNETFFYGFRGKIYFGEKGTVEAGGVTLSQKQFDFEPNSLVGGRISLFYKDSEVTESYQIDSNDKNTITITGGTWSQSQHDGNYQIFNPVYFGAAEYPWRRLYTTDGDTGGIRFGWGSTNDGQNGLLYMDAAGDIYWRNKSGTRTKLN